MELLARLDHLRSELKARYEVDLPGIVAGARGRLEGRLGLSALPVDADLADHRGRLGLGRVRTWAFETPELRKAALVHVDVRPVIEGMALTLHPRRERRAPVFAADLMLLPTRLSANADVYGPAELTRGLLAPLGPSFARLDSGPGKAWAASVASGEGLHASVSPRLVDEAFAAVTGALGRFLDALLEAPTDGDGAAAQEAFFAAFHAHGPRVGALGRIFGEAWAERFSRLVFE